MATTETKTNKTIESVIKDELCTGCGTCVGLCPKEAIEMVIDRHKGIYVPQLDKERCNECGICFEVCPGHAVDFKYLNQEIFSKQTEDIILGNYLNCYLGHATDYDIRFNSASGGLVTALLIFALEQGIINGALVTKMSEENPLEPEPFIARTREEIIAASKSKYCPVPANIALKEILKEEGKFAVVGLPCHTHGIRKAELVNKKLKGKIALHLGLICGHTPNFMGTEFLLRRANLTMDEVTSIDYRGKGWPGVMAIQSRSSQDIFIPYFDAWRIFGYCFYPTRCILCCDGAAELAAISLGDAWLPELSHDKLGTSVIVSRSEIVEKILQDMMSQGKLQLVEVTNTTVTQSQGGFYFKKRSIKVNILFSRLSGSQVPSYETKLAKLTPQSLLLATLVQLGILLSSKRFLWKLIPLYLSSLRLIGKVGRYITQHLRLTGL